VRVRVGLWRQQSGVTRRSVWATAAFVEAESWQFDEIQAGLEELDEDRRARSVT
jgi:predicted transcriptional regulator